MDMVVKTVFLVQNDKSGVDVFSKVCKL